MCIFIGVGAQSTLGETFLPENICIKNNKIPEFYMIYARKKLTKCPNSTRFLPEKNSFCYNLGGTTPCPRLLRLCILTDKRRSQQVRKVVLDPEGARLLTYSPMSLR